MPRSLRSRPSPVSTMPRPQTVDDGKKFWAFNIKSMCATIDLLAVTYSPKRIYKASDSPKYSVSDPQVKKEEPAQPQGGLANGTMPTPLLALSTSTENGEMLTTEQVAELFRDPIVHEYEDVGVAEDQVVKGEALGGGDEEEEGEEVEWDIQNIDKDDPDLEQPTSCLISDLEYDGNSNRFSLNGAPVMFSTPEVRAELLASFEGLATVKQATGKVDLKLSKGQEEVAEDKVEKVEAERGGEGDEGEDDVAAGSKVNEETVAPNIAKVLEQPYPYPGSCLTLPKPLNMRHQSTRKTYASLNRAKAKLAGRWVSKWTKASLLASLDAFWTRPKHGLKWSDFSHEEKLLHFDMIDWPGCPDDIPPKSLLFDQVDPWSTWA